MSGSTSIPKTMRALVIDQKVGTAHVKDHPVPSLDSNEVLIKISHVSQNPTDWKHVAQVGKPNAVVGCDYSGQVVALGDNLKVDLKVGDKVAGCVHGGLFENKGCFAEYAKQESDLVFKIPDNLDEAGASNFGVPWVTALQGMVQTQKRAWPPVKVEGEPWYLIYGASSSVGLFCIQVAKIYGFRVIAVCSPHNYDLVKSYGADECVDYHDSSAAIEQIKKISGGGVGVGMDTISEGGSFEIAVKSFKEGGGRLNAILPPPEEAHKIRKDVEIHMTLMYTLFGKPFDFGPMHFDTIKEDRQFGEEIFAHSAEVIKKYGIKANPLEHRGGLDDIPAGLKHMQEGKVSGKKLVYKIAWKATLGGDEIEVGRN